MNHLKVITWARWKVEDSYDNKFYTVFTLSVLKPDFRYSLPTVAMSIVKGKRRMFLTFPTLESCKGVFVIPSIYLERLEGAYEQAEKEATQIRTQQQAMHRMANLAPGSQIVRTDTGEVIAEAERIIKEAQTNA